jgi:hypothetical protein
VDEETKVAAGWLAAVAAARREENNAKTTCL